MADMRDQVHLTTQSTEDILGEIFESLGDLPAAPIHPARQTLRGTARTLVFRQPRPFKWFRERVWTILDFVEANFPERDEITDLFAGNMLRDAPGSGLAERSSVVEIDGALVRLPDSTNSGESGGDELSEVERIRRADGHLHPGTEMTSGDERDRAASRASRAQECLLTRCSCRVFLLRERYLGLLRALSHQVVDPRMAELAVPRVALREL